MIRLRMFSVFMLIAGNAISMQPPPDRTAEIDSLLSHSFEYQNEINLITGLEYAIDAALLSEETNYSKGKAKSFFYIGQILWSLGDYNKTLKYLKLAEQEKYIAYDPQLHSEIHRVKGRVFGSLDLYKASILEFKKGEQLIKLIKAEEKRNYLQSLANENLAYVYSLQNKSDSALYYLNKNRKLLESMDEDFIYRNKINLYGLLGKEYSALEQYDSTAYYLKEAFFLCKKYDFPYTSWICLQWGHMEEKKGDIDNALNYYYKGLDNLKNTGLKNELLDTYKSIANIYSQKGKSDSVIFYQEKINTIELELAEVNNNVLDNALDILYEEEQKKNTERIHNIHFKIGIFSGIALFLIFLWWIIWIKHQKRLIEKKENKVAELEEKINDNLAEKVIELAKRNDNTLLDLFNKVYPNIYPNLKKRCPNLILSELQFCVLIYLNFSSKEIAQILSIEHRSVQTRKSRMRKKLNLDSETDLFLFMKSMDKDNLNLTN
ncbi:MAG: LuxR C-terminal-related transcriptional regulator [Dysgonamonadaceae bacterium]